MSVRRICKFLGLAMLVTGTLSVPARATHSTRQWEDDDRSYDKARRAVDRGEALPVAEVMKRLRARFKGDVVATEYEYEFDRWVYEFKIIDPTGRVQKIHLDAATGEVVKVSDD